ncbi:MAG: allophanate hydrolase [Pseudomonadota bacterium]|nr:allophanate hydrolase [Pseudomonadota bacterium]
MPNLNSLLISDLHRGYDDGSLTPALVVERLLAIADRAQPRNIWITRFSLEQVMRYVDALAGRSREDLPLYGIPFVIKDNIDLAGVPTTAACPAFAYTPPRSAGVVQRLLDAGAIPLGKTNLDQFATGLAGVRSPYGACRNSFNPAFVSGGSSAGSAVAVATGLASFSLGTDTAGSGRVPAAFNNVVGLKPTLGRLSTAGVVPACRSIDCVSIFALTAGDAGAVLQAAEGFDAADAYSRAILDRAITGMRFGVPRREQLNFFGDAEYSRLFAEAVERLESLGGLRVEIDFAPFLEAARLLYDGPWIAERYAAIGEFMQAHPDALLPVTHQLIEGGKRPSAAAVFAGQHRLMALKRDSEAAWAEVDLILTPTAGTIYSIAAIEADPIRLNSTLGYYTNFMNLFDLAGVAVPAGFRNDGLPFGVTLVGPSSSDRSLLRIADRLHRNAALTLGASNLAFPPSAAPPPLAATPLSPPPGFVAMAVCGAHMRGLPLNHQLRDRGCHLLQTSSTASRYRLYALPGGPPYRPGLVRVANDGDAIALEVWAMPTECVGGFIAAIPAPLGIGKIELQNGAWVPGFTCEAYAAENALDITAYGGWRGYIDRQPLR